MNIKINIIISEKGYTFFENIRNLDGFAKKLNIFFIVMLLFPSKAKRPRS
tara:strand:- start:12 stop:161 length:150 start_codon:yes stop_codon:yes gene_type:complete